MISLYILIGIASFVALVWMLRTDRVSLGLPIGYLGLLLLNHLPGAYAHVAANGEIIAGELIARPAAYDHFVKSGKSYGDEVIELGVGLTVLGATCFVIGVFIARLLNKRTPMKEITARPDFTLFCLVGGWFLIYGLSPLARVPSVGAAVVNGGAIWILGVMLGLRSAVARKDGPRVALWAAALIVYPVMMLLLEGFLSYGTATIVTALSILVVSVKSKWRVAVGMLLAVLVSLNVFVNYFGHRDDIRRVTWGGGSIEQRVDANLEMLWNFEFFDSKNMRHLQALDQRLNQNYFVGLAEKRLEVGYVDYLRGRSITEALLALVPRAIWPEKPVSGGSPKIVSEMTGLQLNQSTSFGVGQVMEFNINFGIPGVILGFLGLGWLIGWLDLKAAGAEARGDLSRAMTYFLPGVALLQPIGSLVELSGSAAAALVAAVGWRWAWAQMSNSRRARLRVGRAVR